MVGGKRAGGGVKGGGFEGPRLRFKLAGSPWLPGSLAPKLAGPRPRSTGHLAPAYVPAGRQVRLQHVSLAHYVNEPAEQERCNAVFVVDQTGASTPARMICGATSALQQVPWHLVVPGHSSREEVSQSLVILHGKNCRNPLPFFTGSIFCRMRIGRKGVTLVPALLSHPENRRR